MHAHTRAHTHSCTHACIHARTHARARASPLALRSRPSSLRAPAAVAHGQRGGARAGVSAPTPLAGDRGPRLQQEEQRCALRGRPRKGRHPESTVTASGGCGEAEAPPHMSERAYRGGDHASRSPSRPAPPLRHRSPRKPRRRALGEPRPWGRRAGRPSGAGATGGGRRPWCCRWSPRLEDQGQPVVEKV